MKGNRILAIALITLLSVASVFAAGQQAVAGVEAPTLIWYQIGDHGPDTDQVVEHLNEYLLENLNLTIDLKSVGFGDYRDKMNVVINAGEYYDIAFTASWRELYPNARKGAYLELGDLLPQVTPDLYKFIPDFVWEGSKIDGKTFCIPAYKDICCAHFWQVNKDIVDKYNLDISSLDGTLESLTPIFERLKPIVDSGEEPNLLLFPVLKTGHRVIPEEFSQPIGKIPLGFDVHNDDGKIYNPFEIERVMDVLRTLREFYLAGYIPAEAATTQKYEESYELFIEGPQGYPGMNRRDQIEIPRQPAWTATQWMTGSAQAISVGSKHPEAALKFIEALNLDIYVHNTIVYGVENEHYEKVSETHIEKDWDKKDYGMDAWTVGTFFETLWTNNAESPQKWEIVHEFVMNAKPLVSNGFLYDPANVQNEVAAVANAFEKYQSLVLTGTTDPDETVPEMLAELKKAGIDKIQDDMQAQYDTWAATK